ncbi:hypothetical protein ABLT31_37025 [Ammoniphilus sp. 3BR4]
MLSVAGILLMVVFLSWLEFNLLLKDYGKKEKWVFIFFMIFATGISIGQALNMDIANPLDWVAFVFKPFSDWYFGIMK